MCNEIFLKALWRVIMPFFCMFPRCTGLPNVWGVEELRKIHKQTSTDTLVHN
jgi:hypothetical protein